MIHMLYVKKNKGAHTTPKVSKSADGMKPTFNAGRLLRFMLVNIALLHNIDFVYMVNLIYRVCGQVYQNCCVKETVLIRGLNFHNRKFIN